MLIRFRVSNFRSFLEEQELALYPSRVRSFEDHVYNTGLDDPSGILKSALIYGANASGKSNIVKAIAFSKSVIISNRKTIWDVPIFLLRKNPEKETKFFYEILIDKSCYQYSFVIKDGLIKEECLSTSTKSNEVKLFIRNTDGEKVHVIFGMKFKNEDSKGFHNTISKGTRPDQLFLNFINEQNAGEIEEILKKVYLWFRNKLKIVSPHSKSIGFEIQLLKNKDLWDFYNSCLKTFDTGIEKLDFEELGFEDPKFQIPGIIKEDIKHKVHDEKVIYTIRNNNDNYYVQKKEGRLTVKKMKAAHKIGNADTYIQFDFNEESDGTNRIMDLIPMLYAIKQGATVIIDELDRSFHTLISEKFFDFFFEISKTIASQFIATTHNLMLLDLKKFRRDEIWFIEKNNEGQSRMYSLEEFKPRFDKQLCRAYLDGRFGAVPIFNTTKEDTDAL